MKGFFLLLGLKGTIWNYVEDKLFMSYMFVSLLASCIFYVTRMYILRREKTVFITVLRIQNAVKYTYKLNHSLQH